MSLRDLPGQSGVPYSQQTNWLFGRWQYVLSPELMCHLYCQGISILTKLLNEWNFYLIPTHEGSIYTPTIVDYHRSFLTIDEES
jgi:hypothetical protein